MLLTLTQHTKLLARLGDLFDFNGNGDLDTIEQAAEFAILQEMMANDDVENENVSTATLQLRTTD